MTPLISKERRIIYTRKIKGFWEEFSHNKIGLVGLIIIIIYAFIAIFAPLLTPLNPTMSVRQAQAYALPEWVSVFPEYSDSPRTFHTTLHWVPSQEARFVNIEWGRQAKIEYLGGGTQPAYNRIDASIAYPYGAPSEVFYTTLEWSATSVKDMTYSIEVVIISINGTKYSLWDVTSNQNIPTSIIYIDSSSITLLTRLGIRSTVRFGPMVFSGKGNCTLQLKVEFIPESTKATAAISLKESDFTVLGAVHGVLGTDNYGEDIYTQLVYGARISLGIGLLAAFVSTSIGILVGVVSGYIGGASDEVLMRLVDILLCLPVLPLLLSLVFVFGKNVLFIVVLIAVFGWLGLSRVIRSQVLSLREMPFIECAKASGANKTYIMLRHVVPNVFPVAFAFLVLSVPSAILLESALSFLGFGDPTAPTWGRMLNRAFLGQAFDRLAWWWIFPPGLAIITLCMAFVFIGHAFDEIVNPRLRRRR